VAKEFSKAAGYGSIALSSALKVLKQMEVIEQTGKKGRAFLYTRKK
jgi:DNA-binding transcriptional regulator GbsR (MarR family)